MEQKIFSEKKRDLHLLVDAHVFDGMFQGTRTFLKGLYNSFDTEKYSITIYLAANNIEMLYKEFGDQPNLKFIQLRYNNKFIRLAFEIPFLIKKHKIDYAHFNYYLPLFLSKTCKYIVTIHDILFLDYPEFFPKKYYLKNKILFRWAAKKADLLNTVSEYSANRIRKHFNLGNKEITILPNAIDSSFNMKRNKIQDRLFIKEKYGAENFLLYVSRLEPRKNHISFLEAYADLKLWEKNISIVFIGKKSLENEPLMTLINEIKLTSNNTFFHFENIEWEELKSFYNSALICLFPSECEGFGIPPLESIALGTPTICSNKTAMQEFSFFGKSHIDPTVENLKYAISELLVELKSDSLNKQLRINSEFVRKSYTWDIAAENLAHSIISQHKY